VYVVLVYLYGVTRVDVCFLLLVHIYIDVSLIEGIFYHGRVVRRIAGVFYDYGVTRVDVAVIVVALVVPGVVGGLFFYFVEGTDVVAVDVGSFLVVRTLIEAVGDGDGLAVVVSLSVVGADSIVGVNVGVVGGRIVDGVRRYVGNVLVDYFAG
jgi:hypothetical protein